MSGRVVLQRPGSIKGVAVMWWEWRDLTAIAKAYGWRGVPDAPRLSSAEASDLANALERARMPERLRQPASEVATVARDGGLNVLGLTPERGTSR